MTRAGHFAAPRELGRALGRPRRGGRADPATVARPLLARHPPPVLRTTRNRTYAVSRGGPHEHHLEETDAVATAIACPVCLGVAGVLPVVALVRPEDPDGPVLEFAVARHQITSRLDPAGRSDALWWTDRRSGRLIASPEGRFDGTDLRAAAGPCLAGISTLLDPTGPASGIASYCWPYSEHEMGQRLAGWASVSLRGLNTVVGASIDRATATAPLDRASRLHEVLMAVLGLLAAGLLATASSTSPVR